MSRVQPSAIRELLRLGADPGSSPSGAATPTRRCSRSHELQAVYAELLGPARRGAAVHRVQRAAEAPRAGRRAADPGRHADCTADDVLIIQGGQQGLDLAAKLVVNAGDIDRYREPDVPRGA